MRDALTRTLLDWYDAHAREMPWRVGPADRAAGVCPDPYAVWLSEVMLQQTTVAAVRGYHRRFMAIWPTVGDLAAAEDAEVMAEWAGLGYYARARNLHKCAQMISKEYQGKFPEEEAELKKLPGIGPYTAAAIMGISFEKPSVVMDGNIERVLVRVFGHKKPVRESKKEVYAYAAHLSEGRTDYPGEYAQGLMDLGAMICTPISPKCGMCPIRAFCKARSENIQETLPVKAKKISRPVKYGTLYFIENSKGELLLEKRPGTDNGLGSIQLGSLLKCKLL